MSFSKKFEGIFPHKEMPQIQFSQKATVIFRCDRCPRYEVLANRAVNEEVINID